MLFGMDFKIGKTEVLINDLKKNTIILCENQKLVDYWKDVLRKIPDVEDSFNVGLDFTEIKEEDSDIKFLRLLKHVIISEKEDYITIHFPNGDSQNFYVSTDVNIVYKCDTYWDLWLCTNDDCFALSEYKYSEEWFNESKDKIIKAIKCGRYNFEYVQRNRI